MYLVQCSNINRSKVGVKCQIWREKCVQWASSTTGGRPRQQHKTELDGGKWSGTYVPLGMTGINQDSFHLGDVFRMLD